MDRESSLRCLLGVSRLPLEKGKQIELRRFLRSSFLRWFYLLSRGKCLFYGVDFVANLELYAAQSL